MFCSYVLGPWFKQKKENVYSGSGQEVHHKTLSLCTTHTHRQTDRVWPWRWQGLLNGKDPMLLSSKPIGHSWNGKLIDHPYTTFLFLQSHTHTQTHTQKHLGHLHPHNKQSSFNNPTLTPTVSECVYVCKFSLANIPHIGCSVKFVWPLLWSFSLCRLLLWSISQTS